MNKKGGNPLRVLARFLMGCGLGSSAVKVGGGGWVVVGGLGGGGGVFKM